MFFNDLIFIFILLVYSYFQNRLFLHIADKNKLTILSDNDFSKPQAFHLKPTFRLGGITFFLQLIIVFLYLFFFKDIFLTEYIYYCALFFLIGLADDLKINLLPKFRLFLMIAFLIALTISNELYIEKTGLGFLNNLLEIDIFALFFICLCFLFIINGSNLIDGFNGLLGIHSLIIFTVLFFINFVNGNDSIAFLLFCLSFLTLIFLKFNFPKAKMFFGDSGAYLVGTLIAISVIKTSILNPTISPFFFCILLFYLFFEVFFSFFRKIFVARKNPLLPDKKHLHMTLYKFLLKKSSKKTSTNYIVSVYLNLIYFTLLIPGIFLMKDGLFCRYYFLLLLLFYIYFYKILSKKIKY
tara:strand:- start:1502 stop:2563 length:1062 start_codon:yes stop_codon:yes gene_type:complete